MPSSPSIHSTKQATAHPVRQQEVNDYRQTLYHDGAGVQIAESRRHSGIVRNIGWPAQSYLDFVLYPTNDSSPSPRSHPPEASQQRPALHSAAADARFGPQVTSAKHSSKSRSGPVIVHGAAKSIEALPDKTRVSYQTSAGPTPPPTPRLARLATPDLSDLDEAPFCDCSAEAHVVKRCTACSSELDLWAM
jgi:hypothetical protein